MTDERTFTIKKISNGYIYSDSEIISVDYQTFYKTIDEVIENIKRVIEEIP